MKSVSKEEYEKYIDKYPRKLVRDVYAVCDPPLITYNDFTLGEWPNSVVASTHLYSDDVNDYFYVSESRRSYYIAEGE